VNRDGVPAAPHSQHNPTPSPGCAFSGPEVAEEAVLHVGCLNALADRYSDAGACARVAKAQATVNHVGVKLGVSIIFKLLKL
jgi:hypothetical protein